MSTSGAAPSGGNPFRIGPDGTRAQVIKLHYEWILNQKLLLADLLELDGKVLGCWCSPRPCHGDTLIQLLEILKKERSK